MPPVGRGRITSRYRPSGGETVCSTVPDTACGHAACAQPLTAVTGGSDCQHGVSYHGNHGKRESADTILAQFPGLAISNAEILIHFSNKIHGSNFIKQHSETVTV